MEDDVHSRHHFRQQIAISNVPFDPSDIALQLRRRFAASAAIVIQRRDRMAGVARQAGGQVSSDKTRAPGYQNLHCRELPVALSWVLLGRPEPLYQGGK